ncbi:type II toxin-antitoxin system RelE/ParE family toxin [Xenorhabdus nematophila]|nr:plasmid maintenance system killer protein [Xenorhabdus nematophila]MBA0020833.1 type II toxin-antitoxin system RelE/ParE family toxin [Xenorhabdus nematophila]MCB4424081.1 plasmid maintenance system killer protein [Xenorhabdus nematophila]QNJ38449.1 type II toxin-antitoxin system RelE/ParE family toxin [Xenorhabdus nematophila]
MSYFLNCLPYHDAEEIWEINLPGYDLHPLTGDRRNQLTITVSGNWRVTFEFIDGDAYIVNYEDYH